MTNSINMLINKMLGEYFVAIKQQNEEIKQQNEEIKQQNEEIKQQNEEIKESLKVISTFSKDAAIGAARNEYHVRNIQGNMQRNFQIEIMSKYMDVEQSSLYKRTKRLKELLFIKAVAPQCGELIRTGNLHDGGYVMLGNFNNGKIAYSCGISDDVSWDKYMTENGFDVFMYDHTIDKLPEDNPRFHWEKCGITGIYSDKKPELETLEMLIEENNHADEKNIILKMDIEGAEWDVIDKIQESTMEKFDQILIEMHDMNSQDDFAKKERVLEKINRTHQLVHIHGNHNEPYVMIKGMVMPNVIECTYVRKDICQFEQYKDCLPNELDRPNNPFFQDIFLGKWNL